MVQMPMGLYCCSGGYFTAPFRNIYKPASFNYHSLVAKNMPAKTKTQVEMILNKNWVRGVFKATKNICFKETRFKQLNSWHLCAFWCICFAPVGGKKRQKFLIWTHYRKLVSRKCLLRYPNSFYLLYKNFKMMANKTKIYFIVLSECEA